MCDLSLHHCIYYQTEFIQNIILGNKSNYITHTYCRCFRNTYGYKVQTVVYNSISYL